MNVGNVGLSSSSPVTEGRKVEAPNMASPHKRDDLQPIVEKPVTKEEVQHKVKTLNEFLAPMNTSLHYEFHEKLERYYVQIVNDKTKEVVREIPNKKFLDMYAAMAELIGLVVDERI